MGYGPLASEESTVTSQTAGTTFRFWEAVIIVGVKVGETSGSTSSPSSGPAARASSSASPAEAGVRPVTVRIIASTSGISRRSGSYAPSFSIKGAAFTSALSAMPGIEACPLRPRTRSRNGALIFSDTEQA